LDRPSGRRFGSLNRSTNSRITTCARSGQPGPSSRSQRPGHLTGQSFPAVVVGSLRGRPVGRWAVALTDILINSAGSTAPAPWRAQGRHENRKSGGACCAQSKEANPDRTQLREDNGRGRRWVFLNNFGFRFPNTCLTAMEPLVRRSETARVRAVDQWKREFGHLHQNCVNRDRNFAFGDRASKYGGRASCSTTTAHNSESNDLLTCQTRLLR